MKLKPEANFILTWPLPQRDPLEIIMEEETKDLVKDEGEIQIYELGYHLLPTIAEENINEEVAKIHSILTQNGANIIGEGLPSLRELSYQIQKRIETKSLQFSKAYFGWVKFELDRSKIAAVKSKVEVEGSVLRFLIVKTVRENTMHVISKIPTFKKENTKEEILIDAEEKVPVSEAEIDKSIDELLVN